MILNDEATWPVELVQYLQQHDDVFFAWERRGHGNSHDVSAACAAVLRYDTAIHGLWAVLNAHALHGYHCTRLTESEIDHVVSNGMQLPNAAVLSERIQTVQDAKLIEPHVAERLRKENCASENNRAGMIWFCFYPPHIAGQRGAERLFRSWGGEALYRLHERDPLTGPVLKNIGAPCLVEADIPIANLAKSYFLEVHVYRQFLINRGLKTVECIHHQNRTIKPVPAGSVRRIIRFPEPDFIALTNCDAWTPPLIG